MKYKIEKKTEKSMKLVVFFKKVNKIDKYLARVNIKKLENSNKIIN